MCVQPSSLGTILLNDKKNQMWEVEAESCKRHDLSRVCSNPGCPTPPHLVRLANPSGSPWVKCRGRGPMGQIQRQSVGECQLFPLLVPLMLALEKLG